MGDSTTYSQKASKGCILISEPFLPDPNFERTVIFVCDHNKEGSVGFVLNRTADLKLGDIVEEFSEYEKELYIGGPVEQNTMHFVHKSNQMLEGSLELGEGLYWGGDFETLKTLIDTKQSSLAEVRFFLGYSGWAPKQLQREINEKTWIVYKPESITEIWQMEPTNMWRIILKKMGGKFKMISNYPIDPRLN
jgi:putative transcriptional regulator